MRRIAPFVSTLFAGLLLSSPSFANQSAPAPNPKAIAVEPVVVAPGQPVTLRWYFTGDKVQVSGGRFGKGLIVTGKTLLKDTPLQTTTYKFDVWYKVPTIGADGQTTQKEVHVQYNAVAQVAKPIKFTLKTYRDPFGWQVAHLLGWKHDREELPDPTNNALVFFQQEDDSVERLAVSVLPTPDLDKGKLLSKIESSLTDNYDEVQVGEQKETQQAGAPAVMTSFSGLDHAHPGTRTQTLLLAFVKNGRGYVVSARTEAKQFDVRRPMLEKMVRSFALVEKMAQK